jgi:hypothetical protein
MAKVAPYHSSNPSDRMSTMTTMTVPQGNRFQITTRFRGRAATVAASSARRKTRGDHLSRVGITLLRALT